MNRNTVVQSLNTFAITVGTTATPLSTNPAVQSAYIDAVLICLYSTAANSIFWGNETVTVTTGNEIPVGVTIQLSISNERPSYELQQPLDRMAASMQCAPQVPYVVPFVYWDLSTLCLVAAANTAAIITPLKRMWV